jgi:ABC-type branched-subunit amino acid transport system substrate-binding protein
MDPTAQAISEAFREAISKHAQRSEVQILPLDEANQQMDSLFEAKNAPQLIYYLGGAGKLVELWKELPEQALKRSWIQENRMETWLSENDKAPQPEALYCLELQLPTGDPLSPQYEYFRGRFGEPGVYTLAAYDALAVLAHALQKTGKSGRDGTEWDMAEVMRALKETELHGLTGPVSFDEKGIRTQVTGKILKWSKGHWERQWSGIIPKSAK